MPNVILSTLLSALLILSNGVAAKPPSTSTSQACNTQMGTKKVARVPTASTTVTVNKKPAIATTIVFSTITNTPQPTTTTITNTATSTVFTTNSAITGTFSTTSTDFVTETPTTTLFTTVTAFVSTDTTTTTTPIVATPAGFRPIQDTVNGYPAMKRELQLPAPHPLEARQAAKKGCNDLFPVAVKCTKSIIVQSTRTLTVTGRPKTTTAPQQTSSSTTTTTVFTTSTVVPPAVTETQSFSTTSTITSLATSISTSTSTSTVITSTIEVVAPTQFLQCASNNFVGPLSDGRIITNIFNNGPNTPTSFRQSSTGEASAYDCCIACAATTDCQVSFYTTGTCLILFNKDLTCPAEQSSKPSFFTSVAGTSGGFTASNGKCGYAFSGNSDGSVSPVQ